MAVASSHERTHDWGLGVGGFCTPRMTVEDRGLALIPESEGSLVVGRAAR